MPEGLANKPELDIDLVYLWNKYVEVKQGCERLTFSEIAAYGQLTGYEFSPWEVDILIQIDSLRRENG